MLPEVEGEGRNASKLLQILHGLHSKTAHLPESEEC
jgi:hypothetical protein